MQTLSTFLFCLYILFDEQIKAYTSCGKLKAAYLIAVKARLVDEVKNISEIASKAGQLTVREICEKWLQSNAPK